MAIKALMHILPRTPRILLPNLRIAHTRYHSALAKPTRDLEHKCEATSLPDRAVLESVLTRRFFIAPSFDIYGGTAGLYDLGPPGAALQTNLMHTWRRHFVRFEGMMELDCAHMTPHAVLQASGHVDRFADVLLRDSETGEVMRADHLLERVLKERIAKSENEQDVQDIKRILTEVGGYGPREIQEVVERFGICSPNSGARLEPPQPFNLMFSTTLGLSSKGYLRPETAQGHFTNFKKLLECNAERLPFASASVGKAYRNEISPRSGLLRTREFWMAEIEHFVDPLDKSHTRFDSIADTLLTLWPASLQQQQGAPEDITIGTAVQSGIVNNESLGYYMARTHHFLTSIGLTNSRIRFRQHLANEMAHYACDCWDAEVLTTYGWVECAGLADRSAYDLNRHGDATGTSMVVRVPLDVPVTVQSSMIVLDKAKCGRVFRKEFAVVADIINGMYNDDGMLDEAKWEPFAQSLARDGQITVQGNGKSYTLTSDMVSVKRIQQKQTVRTFVPNVIEPSFGISRILYCLLEHSFYTRPNLDSERRHVFRIKPSLAPTQVLVTPLLRSPKFDPHLSTISDMLRDADITFKCDTSATSIGKRYARMDELGVPFAITIDFETLQNGSVTLRERDTMEQGVAIKDVVQSLAIETTSWSKVRQCYDMIQETTSDSLEGRV